MQGNGCSGCHGAPHSYTDGEQNRSLLHTTCAYGWAPPEVLQLPLDAQVGLLSLLALVEQRLALPSLDLLNLVSLFSKPNGGDRPIASMGFIYRILMACRRGHSSAWTSRVAKWWDTAAAMRDPLRTTIYLSLIHI